MGITNLFQNLSSQFFLTFYQHIVNKFPEKKKMFILSHKFT